MTVKPTIVFVPGFWEGPLPFSTVSSTLKSRGYNTITVSLPSTGSRTSDHVSMNDDIAAIRTVVKQLIKELGDQIILVMHSAGGFLGSAALEGLCSPQGADKGKKEGVKGLIYLTAGIMPEGMRHEYKPFCICDEKMEEMYCVEPLKSLFNDLSKEDAEYWLSQLKSQPADGYNEVVSYGAYKDLPSTYLICENDQVLPPEIQKMCAGLAGSEILSCESGHMVILTMPDLVVELIERKAQTWSTPTSFSSNKTAE